ncbi:vomeronasal type-2 receptor 26-like [Phyllobates terribilis]|uniref:vomeronasal type-2 receptor 26-like n=1 Tax=Phyllobates terribilis TaxID=111132 RepID=UPI003CCB4CC0
MIRVTCGLDQDTQDYIKEVVSVSIREYQQLMAFIFTIDEINQRSDLLPNVTLGYHVFDSCGDINKVIKDVLHIMTGILSKYSIPNYSYKKHGVLAGYIGDLHPYTTNPMAELLSVFGYTQISYGARDPLLSNRNLYPNFFRTVQSYETQHVAIAKLMKSFGWNWVGIITSYNDAGEREAEHLIQTLRKYGICTEYEIKISLGKFKPFRKELGTSFSEILIVCGTLSINYLRSLGHIAYILRQRTIILPASWSIAIELIYQNVDDRMDRSLMFAPPLRHIPGFQDYLYTFQPSNRPDDKLLEDVWIYSFSCFSANKVKNELFPEVTNFLLHNCTGRETYSELFNYFGDSATYKVYISVMIMAHALHDLYTILQKNGEQGMKPFQFQHKFYMSTQRPWIHQQQRIQAGIVAEKLLHYQIEDESHASTEVEGFSLHSGNMCFIKIKSFLRKFKFYDQYNEFFSFNEKGEFPENLEIVNWVRREYKQDNHTMYIPYRTYVGSFNPSLQEDEQLTISPEMITWRHGKTPTGLCSEVCFPGTRRSPKETYHTCCYNCIPCSEGYISNISDSEICHKCPDEKWPNEEKDECIPKIIEYLSYEQDVMAAVFSSMSELFFIITIHVSGIFIFFLDTPIVKANNRNISFILLLSLKMSLFCVFLFIGRPNDTTCMLRQISTGVTFTVAVSSILAKSIMVSIAFKATRPGSSWRRWMGVTLPNSVVLICSFVQFLNGVIWLSVYPPFQEMDMDTYPGKIIIQCNEGSVMAFYFMLGYMGFLAAVSFVLAFMVRTLPDIYNEAKYITFSMLLFCSVWICAIPAYLSSNGKNMVMVQIFSILASEIGILGCIFFPKCYNIIMRPEMNSRRQFLEKH